MPRSLNEAVFMVELLNHWGKDVWMLFAIVLLKRCTGTVVMLVFCGCSAVSVNDV